MANSAEAAAWWLRTALGDLHAARVLSDADGVPARVAVHLAHQAAEKSLKAVIASGGAEPARTHDLVFLHLRCPTDVQLAMAHIDIVALSAALSVARHPPIDEPPIDDAEVQRRLGEATDMLQISIRHADELGVHRSGPTPA